MRMVSTVQCSSPQPPSYTASTQGQGQGNSTWNMLCYVKYDIVCYLMLRCVTSNWHLAILCYPNYLKGCVTWYMSCYFTLNISYTVLQYLLCFILDYLTNVSYVVSYMLRLTLKLYRPIHVFKISLPFYSFLYKHYKIDVQNTTIVMHLFDKTVTLLMCICFYIVLHFYCNPAIHDNAIIFLENWQNFSKIILFLQFCVNK